MKWRIEYNFGPDDEYRRLGREAAERAFDLAYPPPVPPGELRAIVTPNIVPSTPVKPFDSVAEANAFGDEVEAWLRKQATP